LTISRERFFGVGFIARQIRGNGDAMMHTEESLQAFKVADLQKMLKDEGENTKGNKAELIKVCRLSECAGPCFGNMDFVSD
jgi:hypothetical protein